MFRKILRDLGIIKATLLISSISIISSVAINSVVCLIINQEMGEGLILSIIIPAIIAPPISFFFLKITFQLYS